MRGVAAFVAAGLAFIALGAGALAQEDLEKGKSGAQLFANDCAICHKTPQAVLKGGAPGEGFLRQHYTSSRESAASVAAYLRGVRRPAPEPRSSKPKSAAKPSKGVKQAQPAEGKPSVSEPKPVKKGEDAKTGETIAPERKEQPDNKKPDNKKE